MEGRTVRTERAASSGHCNEVGSLSSASELSDGDTDDSSDMEDCAPTLPAESRPAPVSWRRTVHNFLTNSPEVPKALGIAAAVYQLGAAAMVIGLFIVDNVTDPTVTTKSYWRTELTFTLVWAAEYGLRLWSCVEELPPSKDRLEACRGRLFQAVRPMMLLDLCSLISLVVDLAIEENNYRGVAALRMLRLLTIYRIERDFQIFGPVIAVLTDMRAQLFATLGIAVLVLSVASIAMYYVEAPTNDEFHSVLISMWWCTTALTTVGYGDIVPKTTLGRVLASIVAFMGTGMFGLFAGIIAEGFREAWNKDKRFQRRRQRASAAQQTPQGGSPRALLQPLEEMLRRRDAEMLLRLEKIELQVAQVRAEAREHALLVRGLVRELSPAGSVKSL
uniref:Ion transport domain-containing protein n=1 Tax=Alexandrium monilatum TaxID=311494 RepID=A0A7S4QHC5_9DINO